MYAKSLKVTLLFVTFLGISCDNNTSSAPIDEESLEIINSSTYYIELIWFNESDISSQKIYLDNVFNDYWKLANVRINSLSNSEILFSMFSRFTVLDIENSISKFDITLDTPRIMKDSRFNQSMVGINEYNRVTQGSSFSDSIIVSSYLVENNVLPSSEVISDTLAHFPSIQLRNDRFKNYIIEAYQNDHLLVKETTYQLFSDSLNQKLTLNKFYEKYLYYSLNEKKYVGEFNINARNFDNSYFIYPTGAIKNRYLLLVNGFRYYCFDNETNTLEEISSQTTYHYYRNTHVFVEDKFYFYEADGISEYDPVSKVKKVIIDNSDPIGADFVLSYEPISNNIYASFETPVPGENAFNILLKEYDLDTQKTRTVFETKVSNGSSIMSNVIQMNGRNVAVRGRFANNN